eukprot:GHVU01133223.1.p1 GENE.GHVU01133223.1~~GHVU01133223.1.p1  ORF type:complete len:346 (-),score=26.86 GHVU01133223.1:464-1441(-)
MEYVEYVSARCPPIEYEYLLFGDTTIPPSSTAMTMTLPITVPYAADAPVTCREMAGARATRSNHSANQRSRVKGSHGNCGGAGYGAAMIRPSVCVNLVVARGVLALRDRLQHLRKVVESSTHTDVHVALGMRERCSREETFMQLKTHEFLSRIDLKAVSAVVVVVRLYRDDQHPHCIPANLVAFLHRFPSLLRRLIFVLDPFNGSGIHTPDDYSRRRLEAQGARELQERINGVFEYHRSIVLVSGGNLFFMDCRFLNEVDSQGCYLNNNMDSTRAMEATTDGPAAATTARLGPERDSLRYSFRRLWPLLLKFNSELDAEPGFPFK